ncbi:protein-(glutamine-N5) methyltransferase, release factor-specific [Actinophytocola xinjiangensis]|uniref:Release factor glutamine methyltransferase n=1 Tax=Actinophytocola xinjiangensis TaxID=485602 RepID=A0A7Z1AWU8_9PSEU|nr:protein-(glutamine-N5) methyltransferase, release factor-specific [Actinophytocola xinjiangensis]
MDETGRHPLRVVLRQAQRVLARAGVASPRVDAELIAAHVLDVDRGRLPLVGPLDDRTVARIDGLVARRATRVPLQHLLGHAAFGPLTLAVGPGVFVPRPETELLHEWGLAALRGVSEPLVVDLCTGSGALALALAAARRDATVHAVELDPDALAWARRNAEERAADGDRPVVLHAGDVTDPTLLADLDGRVDLVVCNPPYVPLATPVPPEVAGHDPARAVFGGEDGLSVIPHVVRTAARLLRPGGAFAMEHDDTHRDQVLALLAARGGFTGGTALDDLTGRPRFVTARRTG